ncbi:uncharacterized protein LOC110452805 isoform X2 [Mizuhopecten yessoensis]|uniref:uncharacterized protein LOC110452805 isoform X2 n=1 Tax=Mizuhopecten yessoensis TaxID=6573 RepID=UPI000B45AC8E|nr:uncharacterized protein LOC110452805 isoform X2 [Mizuhopecten yessoensis]
MLGPMPDRGVKHSEQDPQELVRARVPSSRPASLRLNKQYVYLSDEGEDSAENNRHFNNTLESYVRRRAKYSKRKSSKRASASKITKSTMADDDSDDDDSIFGLSDGELEEGMMRCSFGRFSKRRVINNLQVKCNLSPRRECRCSATVTEHDELVCGWESKYQTGKYYRPVKVKRKTQNHNIPHAYQRILPERDTGFDFHHYEEPSQYMEQYRHNHTVGDVCKVSYYHSDDVTMADHYAPRAKGNVCSIAENCDFLAILSVGRENDNTNMGHHQSHHLSGHDLHSEEENNDDTEKNMSVHDRGKKLNLAPVRKATTSRPKLCKSNMKMTPKKTTRSTHSQYLNLVIPKTTLHRKDLQLNVQPVKDTYAARFDTRRLTSCPNKNAFIRTGSADSVQSPQQLTGGENSPVHRMVELKYSRSNTFHINSAPIPGHVQLPREPVANRGSSQYGSPTKGRHSRGCDRIHTILPSFPNDMHNKIHAKTTNNVNANGGPYQMTPFPRPQAQRVWEGGDRVSSDSVKNDTVIPVPLGSFGVRGRTCNGEDRVTIGYRLKRDRERRVGLSAVT